MRNRIESSFKVDENYVNPSFVEFKIKIYYTRKSESGINAAPACSKAILFFIQFILQEFDPSFWVWP